MATFDDIFALSDAFAFAEGIDALSDTVTSSSVDGTDGNEIAEGWASAFAVGDDLSTSSAFTELVILNDTGTQFTEIFSDAMSGERMVAYSETAGQITADPEGASGWATAESLGGEESLISSATALQMNDGETNLQVFGSADAFGAGSTEPQTDMFGALLADDSQNMGVQLEMSGVVEAATGELHAEMIVYTAGNEAAFSFSQTELTDGDGENSMTLFAIADAFAGGDAEAYAETSGDIFNGGSAMIGVVSSSLMATGTEFGEGDAVTDAAGSGDRVMKISRSFGRYIDETTASQPMTIINASTTIITIDGP